MNPEQIQFVPRPKQREVLDYTGGMMGVSAVPGSGKTWTLSLLATGIITSGVLGDEQEVLVVTLVNSAVDHFYRRVSHFLEQSGYLPNLGYCVRTLHGLAHDIVRERPELLGLENNFQIVDEREAGAILDDAVEAWLRNHPGEIDSYLDAEMDESKRDWILRKEVPDLLREIALSTIRLAKDHQLSPELLAERLRQVPADLPLAHIACEIYADYQRGLIYRGAVDFDDLIRLAYAALKWDQGLLERLRLRWPYILEDEAQDSSLLQEHILRLLAGPQGNWVRVGDPNQAIYETFTTANPKYLEDFLDAEEVSSRSLPNSGRFTQSIIELANYLVKWTNAEHPTPEARDAFHAPPFIEPAPPGDPQPNPPDDPQQIFLVERKYTPQEEILAIADSLQRWLPDHSDQTVAVLAPRNLRAAALVDELSRRGIEYTDSLLQSTQSTRFSARNLKTLLDYLADPGSPAKLANVFQVWRREDRQEQVQRLVKRNAERLRKCRYLEDFIWPQLERGWLEELDIAAEDPDGYAQLIDFRLLVARWLHSALLPVDQIVLSLSQDLLSDPVELAVAHKLALMLRRAYDDHPSWRLPELSGELDLVARNQRRFLGFSQDDRGFDPEKYKGKVVVSTIHKAKGLEWDRVYLMSVNNYDFPSGLAYDTYISEKWYLLDRLNLVAEALEQFRALYAKGEYQWYQEGVATQAARIDYVRERLRLLYVGVTRARKELVITWNGGRKGELQPATSLVALMEFWKQQHP